MSQDVDHTAATRLLNESYRRCADDPVRDCEIKDTIDFVMTGKSCLAFRYIMITALTAKATNEAIDILSLQKQDESAGAYDARELAKKVVFPFQKVMLGNVVDGANNDPLVNKPGRETRLRKSYNAKSGDAKTALLMLCDDLPKIETSEQAIECLDYLISCLIDTKRKRAAQLAGVSAAAEGTDAFEARRFLSDLLDKGFGGAALVIVATAPYDIAYASRGFDVRPHPVNQSGSSTRQFSDPDVLRGETPIMGTELKDRPFTNTDVERAAETARRVGARSLLFVAGRRSTFAAQPPTYFESARKKYEKKGLYVGVTSIDALMDTVFASHMDMDTPRLFEVVRVTAEEIGAIEAQMWVYEHLLER